MNSNLHPVFVIALRGHIPPELLDGAEQIDGAEQAQAARIVVALNEAIEGRSWPDLKAEDCRWILNLIATAT